MEIRKPNYTERWVYPFPDEPETGVLVRKLNDAETNRIYDKHKYVPGSKGATLAKAARVIEDMIIASVMDWKGFTTNGEVVACTDANKLLLLDRAIDNEDGERQTVWGIINDKFAQLQDDDLKN